MFNRILPWSGNITPHSNGPESVYIKGDRVVLCEKRISDLVDDYQWRTDPELAELEFVPVLRASYDDFVQASIDLMPYPATRTKCLAVDTICGSHIGNVMFYDIDLRVGEAEMGIMIGDRDYWSRGYGTEAVGLLLDYMFQEYPFNRVYLHTLYWNHRAQRSFRKSGFQDVRLVQQVGQDFIQMEIWRVEWAALRALGSKTNDILLESEVIP